MSPLAVSDGHDAFRLADQLVPGMTAMIGDLAAGSEDAVGEPVVPHELPDVFDGIELRASGWQRNDADIPGYDERGGRMPRGLIHEQSDMGPGRRGFERFLQGAGSSTAWQAIAKQSAERGVGPAERQDKPCALARGRADCPEDAG